MEISTVEEQEKLIDSIIGNQAFLIKTRAETYWGLEVFYEKYNEKILLIFRKKEDVVCYTFIIPYFVLISTIQIDIICENTLKKLKENNKNEKK